MTFKDVICPVCRKEKSLYFSDNPDFSDDMCFDCRENKKVLELGKEAVAEGETRGEDYIICPYCGADYGTDDMHESTDCTCYTCNKEFHVDIDYDVSYSTSKIEINKLKEQEK